MTIDETIKHYEKLIRQNEFLIRNNDPYNFSQLEWKHENQEYRQLVEWLKELKEFKEQEPRKGYWKHGKELCKEYQGRILVDVTYADWHCSECNYVIKGTVKPKWNYCPNCGTKMVETQESEDEE